MLDGAKELLQSLRGKVKMYIVTKDGIVYGLSVAEDTGVRGNVVDLYFHSYEECINFGRRSCTVYILE